MKKMNKNHTSRNVDTVASQIILETKKTKKQKIAKDNSKHNISNISHMNLYK